MSVAWGNLTAFGFATLRNRVSVYQFMYPDPVKECLITSSIAAAAFFAPARCQR
jgi:hypothetical protein